MRFDGALTAAVRQPPELRGQPAEARSEPSERPLRHLADRRRAISSTALNSCVLALTSRKASSRRSGSRASVSRCTMAKSGGRCLAVAGHARRQEHGVRAGSSGEGIGRRESASPGWARPASPARRRCVQRCRARRRRPDRLAEDLADGPQACLGGSVPVCGGEDALRPRRMKRRRHRACRNAA
jgi:hypothetical protein